MSQSRPQSKGLKGVVFDRLKGKRTCSFTPANSLMDIKHVPCEWFYGAPPQYMSYSAGATLECNNNTLIVVNYEI